MRASQLKQFALLTEFSEEEREALADLLEERALPDGKSAVREGSDAEGMILLTEGRLKLKSKRTGSVVAVLEACLLYTSPSPRDKRQSRMPSSA